MYTHCMLIYCRDVCIFSYFLHNSGSDYLEVRHMYMCIHIMLLATNICLYGNNRIWTLNLNWLQICEMLERVDETVQRYSQVTLNGSVPKQRSAYKKRSIFRIVLVYIPQKQSFSFKLTKDFSGSRDVLIYFKQHFSCQNFCFYCTRWILSDSRFVCW